MGNEIEQSAGGHVSPFERIKRTNDAGMEFWSSRDFAEVLGYGDYRNFEAVVEKAKLSCFNSGHKIEDHFVNVTEMVEIGSGATRPVKTGVEKDEYYLDMACKAVPKLRECETQIQGVQKT
jgi:DNA-damage-inducible protein D